MRWSYWNTTFWEGLIGSVLLGCFPHKGFYNYRHCFRMGHIGKIDMRRNIISQMIPTPWNVLSKRDVEKMSFVIYKTVVDEYLIFKAVKSIGREKGKPSLNPQWFYWMTEYIQWCIWPDLGLIYLYSDVRPNHGLHRRINHRLNQSAHRSQATLHYCTSPLLNIVCWKVSLLFHWC